MSGGQLNGTDRVSGTERFRQTGRLAQHSHAMEHFYTHVPGLKVVAPATPADAKGMLKTAIRDDDPVVYLESETLYASKGDVPDDDDYLVPFGRRARSRDRRQRRATLISWSRLVSRELYKPPTALARGRDRCRSDRSAEPTPSRRGDSWSSQRRKKTHRAVVAYEGWPYGGVGAEIVDRIQRSGLRRPRRSGVARDHARCAYAVQRRA